MLDLWFVGGDVDQNGLDNNMGDDSDSLGNTKNSKSSITTPSAKEKRKPFFKKVSNNINCFPIFCIF